MRAKASHGPYAEEGPDGEGCEGELPSDRRHHGRHEMQSRQGQEEADARLHREHGTERTGLGELGNRGRELSRIGDYHHAPEKGNGKHQPG